MKGCLSHPGIKIKAVTRTSYKLEGQGLPKPSPLSFASTIKGSRIVKGEIRCLLLLYQAKKGNNQ